MNNIINGTKISKKLIEEHRDIRKVQKSWKSHIRNGMVCKSKRQKTLWTKKDIKVATNVEMKNSSTASVKLNSFCDEEESEVREEDEITIENIAERIKKRKLSTDKKNSTRVSSLNSNLETVIKRNTRKRLCRKEELEYKAADDVPLTIQKRSKTKYTRTALQKTKQRRVRSTKQSSAENAEKSDTSTGLNCQISNSGLRKTTRKIRHANSSINNGADVTYGNMNSSDCNSSESCIGIQGCIAENNNTTETNTIIEKNVLSDEEIIKEQERMERLVIQEKEDFELALRLQAKFDEMEGIAGRTRRSRKAIENETIELDLYKIDAGRNIQAINPHTAKSSVINHTINSEAKKRGRPPKRVK